MSNAEWIAALTSGEYEQGPCSLAAGGKYCCLGVLAEVKDAPRTLENGRLFVLIEEHPQELSNDTDWDGVDGGIELEYLSGGWSSSRLNREWFTLNTGLRYEAQWHLLKINDSGGTFHQIAEALSADDPDDALRELADSLPD